MIEHRLFFTITPKTNLVEICLFFLVISYALSFVCFVITLSFGGWSPNNGSVDFVGFCSVQRIISLPILHRECFIHYNVTKIIEFGWKVLILQVISCRPYSCLKTLEIGQMQKMTVPKKLLIKLKLPHQMF